MATTPIDFSSVGGKPVAAASKFDFSSVGGKPVMQQAAPQATIGPKETPSIIAMSPITLGVYQALVTLREWANMTPQGKQQHPVQSAVGQLIDRMKGMLVGGAQNAGNNIGTGEYGMLNNPVTSMTMGAPEDETINAVKSVGSGATNLARRAISAVTSLPEVAKGTETGRAITQTLAPEMADAAISTSRNAATTGGPVTTSITNRDVLQHAHDLGIDMSPAEGLQTPYSKTQQTLGEEAFVRGKNIKEAALADKSKLENSISDFQDKLDPHRVGLSSEAAGEHLQNSADIARSAMKDNVNKIYDDVKVQQANLAGDVQGPLQKLIHDESFIKQPGAAVEQPVFQTTAARTAIKDIQDMLSDPAMQGRQSVQSLRNLRTTLMEKGNDYGANALSSSGQRIYKLAAGRVDEAIMDAAKGTDFQETFREAGRQNAKLQELYNTKGSAPYRILNEGDPAKITDGILNRSSVHEIEQLKGENFDLGPLARQTVEDIKNGGFKVTTGGLGGYPDTFLRSLLGPEATKELYMKGEIARRLAENYNPSGSGKVILGIGQLNPKVAVAAQIAASRAKRVDPLTFLPSTEQATTSLSQLSGKAVNQ